MRNLCSIFIYPFVFWSAVSLGLLALPGSLHCVNPVVGLIQGTGKWFLREGAGQEQKSQRKLSLAKTVIRLLLTSSYKKVFRWRYAQSLEQVLRGDLHDTLLFSPWKSSLSSKLYRAASKGSFITHWLWQYGPPPPANCLSVLPAFGQQALWPAMCHHALQVPFLTMSPMPRVSPSQQSQPPSTRMSGLAAEATRGREDGKGFLRQQRSPTLSLPAPTLHTASVSQRHSSQRLLRAALTKLNFYVCCFTISQLG